MRTFIWLCLAAISAGAQQTPSAPAPTPAPKKPEPQKIDSLHELSASLEALSRRVSRAVVQIFASGYAIGGEEESGRNAAVVTRQRATGSGVILSADGYIVTNRLIPITRASARRSAALRRSG